MTFNDNANIDPSKVSRRGRTTGIAVGGGGLGLIALFVISQLLGVDLTGLVSGTGTTTGQQASDQSLSQCTTGAQANANIDCLVAGAADSIDTYWTAELPKLGGTYHSTHVELFTDQTDTGCGTATTAVGPFYCPTDELIYLDTGFYDQLRSQFGASGGPLAEMYVIAHEWGHHIQNLSGIMNGLDFGQTGPASDSVRLELQADCFAGAWVGAAAATKDSAGVTFLQPVTDQQIADALNAAAAVGDDRIQQETSGQVSRESWTHGSSASRQKWFTTGYQSGPDACTTFSASAADL
jgi:predicted metalloprotease